MRVQVGEQVLGPHFEKLQKDIANDIRAYIEKDQTRSLAEVSIEMGYSHATLGGYVRRPETMNLNFIFRLADFAPEFRHLKGRAIRALCLDHNLTVPEGAREVELKEDLRQTILSIKGLVTDLADRLGAG